jgi:glucosyl-3-phosphoglycerate synthase
MAVPGAAGSVPLVDEIVVMDSGSTDRTAEVARAAGARVVARTDVLAEFEPLPGKGEVLWRSLAATDGDLVCFIDSDLVDFDAGFVPALLGPLLTADGVHLVKGFYRRPLRLQVDDAAAADYGGGRVTELVARPLLASLRPQLSGVIQPLGGEYAGTRELLEALPFATSYGVEIGLLLDTVDTVGIDAIAQVDLGVRKHRNRSLMQLGAMARQITATALARCGVTDSGAPLVQFVKVGDEWVPQGRDLVDVERPPMRRVRGRVR